MKKLFTIGYEGAELNNFLATLKRVNVHVLLDIRELPISRRKGFSKNTLKVALSEAGIAYRHEKQLGSPKDVRHRLRETWDYKRFFRDFDRHLKLQNELLELLVTELKGNVVLMCYEKDHAFCHRHTVVNELAQRLNIKPVHLQVENKNEPKQASKPIYQDFGKGLSSA